MKSHEYIDEITWENVVEVGERYMILMLNDRRVWIGDSDVRSMVKRRLYKSKPRKEFFMSEVNKNGSASVVISLRKFLWSLIPVGAVGLIAAYVLLPALFYIILYTVGAMAVSILITIGFLVKKNGVKIQW